MTATLAVMAACFAAYGILSSERANAQASQTCSPAGTPEKPTVCMAGILPSPVQVGGHLIITVRINPPLTEGAMKLDGGVLIFDEIDSSVSSLNAFVFRSGDSTVQAAGYTVQPGPSRNIEVSINSLFDGYTVGNPSAMTVQVIGEGMPPPDTSTAIPPTPTDTPTATVLHVNHFCRLRQWILPLSLPV